MIVFAPGNKRFTGTLNYVYRKSRKTFPKIEISGTKTNDEPISLISNPFDAVVAYSPGSNDFTNIDIDVGNYKIFPSHYQLSTIRTGTPPMNFSLLGSNNKSEEWSCRKRFELRIPNKNRIFPSCN